MDNSFWGRISVKIGIAILVIALFDLVFVNYWILKKSTNVNKNQQRQVETVLASPVYVSVSPSPAFSASPSVVNNTVETKTVVEKQTQTIVQTAQKEIFIPIGTGSTFNNNYTDLSGLQVTIDTSKYSSIDTVVFEASVWVEGGNGKAYAQLYNATDGRPVWFSEISTNSPSGTLLTSAKINLENGARTYKIQAKTDLTAYAAHIDNARLKIIMK